MLNNDVQDMLAISGPEESYFDDLYESPLFGLGRVFSPSPMSTSLHEQSTPNRDCDGSYTAEHNTECLSDTGPPRTHCGNKVITKDCEEHEEPADQNGAKDNARHLRSRDGPMYKCSNGYTGLLIRSSPRTSTIF
jgi:hypothetical protein